MFKKLTLRCIKSLWAVFATGVVLLAVVVSLLKVSLPYADKYRGEIESYLLSRFNAEIAIGSIAASWQTSGPVIVLENLRLTPSQSAPLDLSVKETRVEVDFWNSLKEQKLVTGAFLLDGVRAKLDSQVFLKVRPDSRGSQLFENLSHLFLSQIQQFKVVDSFIIVNHQDGRVQDYQIDNLSWVNEGNRHRGQGELYVDGFSNNSLEMIVDLYGQRRENIFGQLYLEASKMDVSPWLTQLIGEHVELDSTQATFQVWGGIKNGLIDRLLLDVTDSGVHWKQAQDIRFLKVEQAKVHWQKQNDDWLLYSQQVQLKTKDDYPDKFDFSVLKNEQASQVQFKGLDVKALSELFSLFNVTKSSELLTQSDIQGKLDSVDLYIPLDGEPMAAFTASDVSFLPPQVEKQGYIGLDNVKLKGYWWQQQGWFELTGEDGELATGQTFSAPFEYQDLNLSAQVKLLSEGLAVKVPELTLNSDELEVKLALEFSNIEQSFLALYGEIKGPGQGNVNQYLPRFVLPEDTYNYLDNAIQMGRGEFTQLAIFGDPSQMPYSDLDGSSDFGKFWVSAEIRDALFQFDSDWPAIEEMDANLTVENSTMVISAHSGRLGQLVIDKDVVATIPLDQDRAHLDLQLSPAQMQLSAFHDLINSSPLDGILGEVFNFVRLDGSANADVNIDIPLDMSPDEFGVTPQVIASGSVTTESAAMSLPKLLLDFEQVASTVSFVNEVFTVEANSARLFQLPIEFTVAGEQQADGYKIDANVNADWDQSQIVEVYDWPVLQHFSGDLATGLKVSVNVDDEGYQYFVAGQADLANAEYKISGPIEKAKGQAGNLDVFVSGDQFDNHIDVSLNQHLFFKGIVPNESAVMEAAHLAIGSDDFQLPDLGFEISLDLPELEFEPTLAFVVDVIKSLPDSPEGQEGQEGQENEAPFMSSPFAITGTVQSLSILGQEWQNVSLDAEPKMQADEPHWLFSVGAKQALTEVKVFSDLDNLGIDVQAEFMQLSSGAELDKAKQQDITAEAVPGEQATVVAPASFKSVLTDSAGLIASLPPITAVCQECSFDDKPIGKITLKATPLGTNLKIEQAIMEYGRNTVELAGMWSGDEQGGMTNLKGKARSRDFGKWLSSWGLNTGIEDSDAKIDMAMGWQGAPFEFNFPTMNGNAIFELGEGSLSEVSDQGARVFSLFSMDSLLRKLKLDFSDVFSKGLFYNDIKGSVEVVDGVAHSNKIKMDGVAGDMEMAGFTNLNSRALDYNVEFKPKLTSSLPVIAMWLAGTNPVTFLGALALDKIIEEEVISEIKIKISGDLDEPKVEEVKRFTKKIKVQNPNAKVEPQPKTEPTEQKTEDGNIEQSQEEEETGTQL